MVVAALGACGAALPPLPSEGGPAWQEIQSEHFTLWTDASSQRGQALVREMEKRRQVMLRAMRLQPRSGKIFAIALRNERELEVFLPSHVAAIAWSSETPARRAGIALHADSPDDEQANILNHEVAHAISYGLLQHQPKWLAEGLATYFENAEYAEEDGTVRLGVPRRDQAVRLREAGAIPVADLLACDATACSSNADFYASSWLLFSHLLNHHYEAFGRYLERLKQLPRDQALQAWQEAFSELSLAKLDAELSLLIRTFDLAVPEISVDVRPAPTTTRALGDADALAARGLLHALVDRRDAALTAARASLAADRTHVLAWLISAWLGTMPTVAEARATAAAHPDDGRAWQMLRAVSNDAELAEAIASLCELAKEAGEPCELPEP
ncbi:MAG: DUF1570 domain-containing protein [Kofleriaceae bacterium]